MTAILFAAQRLSAMLLALAVAVHLATILHAVRGGLTAGEVLARTRGSGWLLAFYLVFVVAAAVHAPIGLRHILNEWTPLSARAVDAIAGLSGLLLLALGLRAAYAVFA
jgi:fumarate reductase subunit C